MAQQKTTKTARCIELSQASDEGGYSHRWIQKLWVATFFADPKSAQQYT